MEAHVTDSLRVINGQRVHEVERKETLFGIARLHGVDLNALLTVNPSIRPEDELRLGQILILPQPVVLPDIPEVVDPSALDPLPHHVVSTGETLYGIARSYGVSVAAIEEANPGLGAGLQPGQKLRIPVESVSGAVPAVAPTPSLPHHSRKPSIPCSANPGDSLRFLMLLPFQFDADTLPGGKYPLKVERLREVAMDMYQGAKWAASELASLGIPVVLDVRDSEPDSLGRLAWNAATADSVDAVLGPLRRSELEAALNWTAPSAKPHWIVTPQSASMLAQHPQALLYEPLELAALEALGEAVATNHPSGPVLVLELAIEGQGEQVAFRRGFERKRTDQGLAPDVGWTSHPVSTRFAEGVIDRILALQPEAVVIPSGPTSRAMVANLQTELQLAEGLQPRIYLHPKADEYQFLDRSFLDKHRVTYPTQAWMDWTDSLQMMRVLPFREDLGVEPSTYAWVAYEALMESARWCPLWSDRLPASMYQQFNWRATGAETGFVNRAWRVQQYCHGNWVAAADNCVLDLPVPEEEK